MKFPVLIALSSVFAATLVSAADEWNPVFAEHCVMCHGQDGKVKGKVNLLELESSSDLIGNPELLEKIVIALEDNEMPPIDEPQLPNELRSSMIDQLDALLKQALADESFGVTPMRRMNRFQYNNAVVDLLELERDVFQLNERMLRRYEDYFFPDKRKMPDVVKVASRPLSKDIDGRRPEGFRGVAPFPQDQRAEHGFDNRGDHLTLSPLLMESFLTLSQTIVESPDLQPEEVGSWNWLFAPPGKPVIFATDVEAEDNRWLKVAGKPEGRIAPQKMIGWGKQWSNDEQILWVNRKQDAELQFNFESVAAGDGLRIGYTKAPDYGRFQVLLDGEEIGEVADLYDPRVVRAADIHIPVEVKPGEHQLMFRCVGRNENSKNFLLGVDLVEVTGQAVEPKPEPVKESEAEAIRSRLTKLLRRAFRRPPNPETLKRFVSFAEGNIQAGASFEDTMRTVVGAVLATPDFLYFYESGDEYDLASRLALFFWGSIPDDKLLDTIEQHDLRDPDVLSDQIDRMLNDPRASRFCDSFPSQWLQLDRLITAVPEEKKYPWFYFAGYRMSMHMMLEPLLLFETVYIEDRTIVDLLDPDFTWESKMLAGAYQGRQQNREDKVLHFQRIPVDDPRRGGVVTNAAVMTMTSAPKRTLPITRGSWVNAVIFNDPPEPPPADIPPLPEAEEEHLETLTIREKLAKHREREDCAGCHNKIDPLGFALENYGPTGLWRESYENGRAVDPSGVLFNKHEFETAEQFKQLLVQEKRRFIRGFVAHLMSFGLGRELEPADSPAI
ncbi:MAG: DUF1592 domain-containing protein, partial [Verrucomicrobiota bacterium]